MHIKQKKMLLTCSVILLTVLILWKNTILFKKKTANICIYFIYPLKYESVLYHFSQS